MIVHFNVRGDLNGGGPSIWVSKATKELQHRGIKVVFDSPAKADWAIGIIESGKILRQIDRHKTKVMIRIDGIYNAEYNKLFNRSIRPDMSALHTKLKSDIQTVDRIVYQSQWSKDRIDEEIMKCPNNNWYIIPNGTDTSLFCPGPKPNDDTINLLCLGKMRDGYLMRTLIAAYKETKDRGIKCRLLLAGSMDGACQIELVKGKDDGIVYLGQFKNNKTVQSYNVGDIFLGARQGSSSDNVISEAQACGLPCIIPSWSGNTDLIKDRETGIIVQTGHWTYDQQYIQGITEAIIEIAKDLPGFKLRARKHAIEELSVGKMMDKYLEVMR